MDFEKAALDQLIECTLDNTPALGPPCGPDAPILPATALSVYDGDTCKLAVHYNGTCSQITCRLLGLDSPEVKRVPSRGKALRAKQILARYLQPDVPGLICGSGCKTTRLDLYTSSAVIGVKFPLCHQDKYGRYLATLYAADGSVINDELLKVFPDLFSPYQGGPK